MNVIQEFLKEIEGKVPSKLSKLYTKAVEFADINFGNDDWETIDFELDPDLQAELNSRAHEKRITFNCLMYEIIVAAITEAKEKKASEPSVS